MTPRLITIKASHYCEKARWALERAGIAYQEECHPPGFHILVARRTSGRRTVPVLVTDEGVLGDSSDILAWVDRRLPEGERLYPAAARADGGSAAAPADGGSAAAPADGGSAAARGDGSSAAAPADGGSAAVPADGGSAAARGDGGSAAARGDGSSAAAPADGGSAAERAEVEALEERFDEALGPHVRRWAYFHLLPRKDLVVPLAAEGVRSRGERLGLRLGYPLLAALMRRAMNITPEASARSVARVDEVWAEVEARLAGGPGGERRYLVGERFSAADLTFAALAAPAVCPPGYGGPLPALEALPPPMRAEVEARRASPAGRFVLRLYREERIRPPS